MILLAGFVITQSRRRRAHQVRRHICGSPDHQLPRCPGSKKFSGKQKRLKTKGTSMPRETSPVSPTKQVSATIGVVGSIAHRLLPMFIADTLATSTLISRPWFASHCAWLSSMKIDAPQIAPSNMAFRFGDGDALPTLGQSLIPTCFQGTLGRLEARIIDATFRALISANSLRNMGAALDLKYERLVNDKSICPRTSPAARLDISFSRSWKSEPAMGRWPTQTVGEGPVPTDASSQEPARGATSRHSTVTSVPSLRRGMRTPCLPLHDRPPSRRPLDLPFPSVKGVFAPRLWEQVMLWISPLPLGSRRVAPYRTYITMELGLHVRPRQVILKHAKIQRS